MKKVDEKIINLTPHKVIVAGKEIESSGIVRIQESNAAVGDIARIPVVRQIRGSVEGLPDFEYGIYYIVSRPIFDALPDRKDLLAIGETIRDSEGRVVGAKNLVGRNFTRREVKAKDVQELSQKLTVEKCLGDVWEILIDYADVEFNYPSTAILLNTKDLKELSWQLKELGF